LAARVTGGILAGDEAEEGGELAGVVEAGEVAEFRDHGDGDRVLDAAQGLEGVDDGRETPGGDEVSPHIRKRLEGLPTSIQDIAWKAQVRLCKRFRRLVARGKHPNVVVTAIARELAAFMWAIAKEVPITA
jgi:hypothetical protein